MQSTLTDEEKKEKEEKKRVVAAGSLRKVKQLYDKTTSGYDNTIIAKNKVQQGYKWFKNGEVHPTSSTAANIVPQSATVPQA